MFCKTKCRRLPDAKARFSASSADYCIISDARTQSSEEVRGGSPPFGSSFDLLQDIHASNPSHVTFPFYSDSFGTQECSLAAEFIIHTGAIAVDNLPNPRILRVALERPPEGSDAHQRRELWLSVELSIPLQWKRLMGHNLRLGMVRTFPSLRPHA